MQAPIDATPTTPGRTWQKPALFIAVVILSLFFLLYWRSYTAKSLFDSVFISAEKNLQSTNGFTNLVLMGIGGEGHEAPDLTDSMVFVAIEHNSSQITTISIPRDIWVTTMRAKVNTAYHYGNLKREGGGLDLAKSAVSEITGQPVHYGIVLNFEGFVRAIDAVGGIDIEVERAFDDFKYPVPGKENAPIETERYQHIRFDEGLQRMDGARALVFTRSRNSEGEEGTDFARSARQQKVITAFLSKLFSSEILLNPSKIQETVGKLKDSVDTDIAEDKYLSFAKIALNVKRSENPVNVVSLESHLINPKISSDYDKQWVLIPKKTWQDIHAYVEESIKK